MKQKKPRVQCYPTPPVVVFRSKVFGIRVLVVCCLALTSTSYDAKAQSYSVFRSANDASTISTQPAPSVGEQSVDYDLIRGHMIAGEFSQAMRVSKAYVRQHPWGARRDSALLAIGELHSQSHRYHLARDAFKKVRLSEGTLAPWAAFSEAQQEFLLGKPAIAARACQEHITKSPDSPKADDCLRLSARAFAALGQAPQAEKAAETYDQRHPNTPIGEKIQLALGNWEAIHDPEQGIARLLPIALHHSAPLTGRLAEELLATLEKEGWADAAIPSDFESQKIRAISLRDSGRLDHAWDLFESLQQQGEEDEEVRKWVESEAESFGWKTRNYEFLAERFSHQYSESKDSRDAWLTYRALSRQGEYDAAATLALTAQGAHGKESHWKNREEDIARILMLGRRYTEAVKQFDRVVARGGAAGRRAQFFSGFSSYMDKDYHQALQKFDRIIERNRSYVTESHYWRARTSEAMGRGKETREDNEWVLSEAKNSWYALLTRQRIYPNQPSSVRNGTWSVSTKQTTGISATGSAHRATSRHSNIPYPLTFWRSDVPLNAGLLSWNAELWPLRHLLPTSQDLAPEWSVPSSLHSTQLYDNKQTQTALLEFSKAQGEHWLVLQAAVDLASVGLMSYSGPLFSQFFDAWHAAYKDRSDPLHDQAKRIELTHEDWRSFFVYTSDDYHTARYSHRWHTEFHQDDPKHQDALRLAYPIVRPHTLWKQAEENGIDPYLILGLMRQESTYNPTAISRAGAMGAMQIMPRTGNLIANRITDIAYSPADLHDPGLSIHYALHYFGLLLQRFDGVYPLALASYNGGPFNVSAWLSKMEAGTSMDEFVEHIPFRETRRYVKKVSKEYSQYVELYTPPGTEVRIPWESVGDHREIVNF